MFLSIVMRARLLEQSKADRAHHKSVLKVLMKAANSIDKQTASNPKCFGVMYPFAHRVLGMGAPDGEGVRHGVYEPYGHQSGPVNILLVLVNPIHHRHRRNANGYVARTFTVLEGAIQTAWPDEQDWRSLGLLQTEWNPLITGPTDSDSTLACSAQFDEHTFAIISAQLGLLPAQGGVVVGFGKSRAKT